MLAIGLFTFICSQHVLSSLLLQTPESWSCNNFYFCKDTQAVLPMSPMQILTRSPPADKLKKHFFLSTDFIYVKVIVITLRSNFGSIYFHANKLNGLVWPLSSSTEAYTSILQKPASSLSKASTIFTAAFCSSRVEVIRKINTLFQDQLLQIKECKLFCI